MQLLRTKSITNKQKTAAAIIAVISAVLLPQLIHLVSRSMGYNAGLGEMLLPMHLPIIFIGFAFGPICGLMVGIASPLLSYVLTGMPMVGALPSIILELAVYGFTAGLLKGDKSIFLKLLTVQIIGRLSRLIAVATTASAVGITNLWNIYLMGLVGVLLQWIIIPSLMRLYNKYAK